jgi:glycosyltransferase involved in cell wall biosynthesis
LPLVSVLLPARDASTTLSAALRSIQRQRLTDWACTIVDDGSRDETAAIAARFAAVDPRFRLLSTPPSGIVAALNAGLDASDGTYLARMDADDVMHRDRLAAQSAALACDPALAAVGCHVRIFPRAVLTPGRRSYETWLNGLATERDVKRDAFIECPIAHPAMMARRSVIEVFRYRDAGWAEDYDLVLRMLEGGCRIGIVPRRLVAWRDAPCRLSRTDPRYAIASFTACKAAFLSRGFLARSETFVLWGYGDTGKALAAALAPHGKRAARIIEVHPGRIGQRIGGVPVFGLDALPEVRGEPLVVSVAGSGPRAEIRRHLATLGFEELDDYVCAA